MKITGYLPKSARKVLEKYAYKIESAEKDDDGYWIVLKARYSVPATGGQIIHERTVRALISELNHA